MIYLVVILNQGRKKTTDNNKFDEKLNFFRNLTTFSKENIIEEIISSTIAECVDETNVDRTSLLTDSFFYVMLVMRNQLQYGRPAIIFCLKYKYK